jgi:hypothetical protein
MNVQDPFRFNACPSDYIATCARVGDAGSTESPPFDYAQTRAGRSRY